MRSKFKNTFIIASLFMMLTSCNTKSCTSDFYSFGTYCSYNFYLDEYNAKRVDEYISKMNFLTDSFVSYENINNIYTINHSSDYVEVDEELIAILKKAVELKETTNGFFNPLIGKATEIVRKALIENEKPSSSSIESAVKNMENASLLFDGNKVKISGSAAIDLGGIAKGFVLEQIYKNFVFKNTAYVFDFGHSSLMLGKPTSASDYKIHYQNIIDFEASDCAISTSSVDEQKVVIDDVVYSHIINTKTYSTTPKYQSVIVKGKREESSFLDVISTVAMNLQLDAIKEYESKYNLEFKVIKDNKVFYESEK